MNDTPADKLFEICRDSGASCECTLHRVGDHLNRHFNGAYFTSDAAAEIGFSKQEAYGIMDGWDFQIGKHEGIVTIGLFTDWRPKDPESYDRGFKVGKRAAQITLEAGLYVR